MCIPPQKKKQHQHQHLLILSETKERKSQTLRVHHPTRLRPAHDEFHGFFGDGVELRLFFGDWNMLKLEWNGFKTSETEESEVHFGGFCKKHQKTIKSYQKVDLLGSLSLRPQHEQFKYSMPPWLLFWSQKETSFVAGGGTKVIPVNSSVFWLDGFERFPQLPQVMDLQIVLFSRPLLKPELSMNDALPGVLSSAGCRLECILAALVDTKKWKRTWKFHSYVIKTYPSFVNIVCYRYITTKSIPFESWGTFGAGSFENGQIKCTSTNNNDKCLQREQVQKKAHQLKETPRSLE